MKLGQAILAFNGGSIWENTSWYMNISPLGFSIVPYQYRAFTHYLEVGPFMSNFIFPPV